MVEVCEGAPVAVGGWVLTDKHDIAPRATNTVCIIKQADTRKPFSFKNTFMKHRNRVGSTPFVGGSACTSSMSAAGTRWHLASSQRRCCRADVQQEQRKPAQGHCGGLSDIAAFNSSYLGGHGATFVELFGHMGDHLMHYSELNVIVEAVLPHGSRLFRLTARPPWWIPNQGTAATLIVSNSSGYYPGNEPWKLNDGVLEVKCDSAGWNATAADGVKVPLGRF